MRKRVIRVMLTALVVGAGLNVALTWSLVGLIGWPRSLGVSRGTIGQGAPKRWSVGVPASWPPVPRMTTASEWWCCTIRYEFAEWPAPIIGADGLRTAQGMEVFRTAKRLTAQSHEWGWPMRSLRSVQTFEESMSTAVRPVRTPVEEHWFKRGLVMPAFLVKSPEVTHLPVMPVWPGFVVNTLVFAVVAVAAVVVPGVARASVRRRRGRCIACGYDLSGLDTCPECGTAAPEAAHREEVAGRR